VLTSTPPEFRATIIAPVANGSIPASAASTNSNNVVNVRRNHAPIAPILLVISVSLYSLKVTTN